jgi:chitinase
MRKYIAIIGFLLCVPSAWAQTCPHTLIGNGFVFDCKNTGSGGAVTTIGTTFSTGYPNAEMLIAQGSTNTNTTITAGMLTNTATYGWTFWGECATPATAQHTALWYYKTTAANGASDTVTFNTGVSGLTAINVITMSGVGVIDGPGLCGSGTAASATSGNYAVSAGDLLIGAGLGANSPMVAGAGWTAAETDTFGPGYTLEEYQLAGGSGTTVPAIFQNGYNDSSNTTSDSNPANLSTTQKFDYLFTVGGTNPSGTAGDFTSPPTVSDGTVLTQLTNPVTTSDNLGKQYIWGHTILTGGTMPTVQGNTTNHIVGPTLNYAGVYYLELTNANTLDQIANVAGSTYVHTTATTLTCPTLTTTQPNEIYICVASDTGYSGPGFAGAGGGCTDVAHGSQEIAYRILTSVGSYSCTLTTNGTATTYSVTAATFYAFGATTGNSTMTPNGGRWADIGIAFKPAANPPATAKVWSVGYYYPNSTPGGQPTPLSNIQWSALTHVAMIAASPNADGSLSHVGSWNNGQLAVNLIQAAHANGVQVLYGLSSIGGPTHFNGACGAGNVAAFIANVMSDVNTYGFDGVDFDYEEAWNASNVTACLSGFRAALGSAILLATTNDSQVNWSGPPVPVCGSPSMGYTLTQLNYLDKISVLGYGVAAGPGSGNPYTWFNNPLFSDPGQYLWSDDYLVQAIENCGAAASKILIGIAFYGDIEEANSGPRQAFRSGAVQGNDTGYGTLAAFFNISAASYDSAAKTAWVPLSDVDCPFSITPCYLTFENPQSVTDKVNHVINNGLGGWVIWVLGWDNVGSGRPQYPLLDAIGKAFTKSSIVGAPGFSRGTLP